MLAGIVQAMVAGVPIQLHKSEIIQMFGLEEGEVPHIQRMFLWSAFTNMTTTVGIDPKQGLDPISQGRFQPGTMAFTGRVNVEFIPVPLTRELVINFNLNATLRVTFDYRIKPGNLYDMDPPDLRQKRMEVDPGAGQTGHTMNKRQLLGA